MEFHLPLVFVVNILLIIVDASIGYHVAPLLLRRQEAVAGEATLTVSGLRSLLAVMVGLYMFFNCLAYFQGHSLFLAVVSGLVVADILVQLVIRRRLGKGAQALDQD